MLYRARKIFAYKPGGGSGSGDLLAANNLSDVANASTARSNLGLAIGSDVQAYDGDLAALAGVAADGLLVSTGVATAAARSISAGVGVSVSNGDGVAGNPTIKRVASVASLTDGATIASDWDNVDHGGTFRVTLAGNRTLSNPSNADDGQVVVYAIKQDATGSRTLTLDTKFRLGTDITSTTLTTTASKTDYLTVKYDSAADKFDVVAFVKGF